MHSGSRFLRQASSRLLYGFGRSQLHLRPGFTLSILNSSMSNRQDEGLSAFARRMHASGTNLEQHTPNSIFSRIPGSEIPQHKIKHSAKVTVVGVGNVGMACAQTMLSAGLLNELALVDVLEDRLQGELLDLQHSAAFLPRVKIVADTDYGVSADSDICIVTAGARQREGESRIDLLDRNVNLFKKIIPELVRHSPDTILLIVSNPVDILAYVSWKLSGLPPNRVIGSGTNLDSSRLRSLLADKFEVSALNVHGYIIGEHGDNSVPLWSSLSVANVPVLNFHDKKGVQYNKETLEEFHKAVVKSAYEVIRLKGYTSWAIGFSVASIVKSLLRDQMHVHPVSVLANSFYGIDYDVFLSLPAQLGSAGVLGIANLPITEDEAQRLQNSAKILRGMLDKSKMQ
ncbi:hypothetical protein KP509_37G012200 [Ceratopteris richardii]|uniref:L-lactate dehydrogenase n=1 Tax=Ceratopteris richardii TaxID=49495 RepID=A0A8T2Q6J2_CERRI|nr:hypothetical protein KP509_37G012200 [Ceratopteris richardii]